MMKEVKKHLLKYYVQMIFVVLFTISLVGCGNDSANNPDIEMNTFQVSVDLVGGTGRASVESPTTMKMEGEQMVATVTWSSSNYDYMIVDGEKYLPVNEDGNSVFEIPVSSLDADIPVIADTTAMSVAHEIQYTLTFHKLEENELTGDTMTDSKPVEATKDENWEKHIIPEVPGHACIGETKTDYAECFRIYQYEDDYEMISVMNGDQYLLIPEGKDAPEGIEKSVIQVPKKSDHIYLAATSAMAFFARLNSIDQIALSGTKEDGWYLESARKAMKSGEIKYAGKYNEPDFEMLVDAGCDLAIESTMIYHTPKVKEMMEDLGIPVFVDYSSYESSAMGRTEWIKVYGALTGQSDLANKFFDDQAKKLSSEDMSDTGKTVAFFYISQNGFAVVRKSADYIADMIETAGGNYIFEDLDNDSASSSVNLSMEEFYACAADADYLIYNSTTQNPISSVDELLAKSELFADFKAVEEGNVWCVGKDMYQSTDITGEFILDVRKMLEGADPKDMVFLTRVEK